MTPPENWGTFIAQQIGLDPYVLPIVAASAIVMYLVLVLILRLFGAHMLSVSSVSTAAIAIVLGAVAGRAILGKNPTMMAGVVALMTLGLMEAIFHSVERSQRARRAMGDEAVVVFCDGHPLPAACKETRTSEADLRSVMRKAGIADPAQVKCIVLEPQGGYSVVRTGTELDPALYKDVLGISQCLDGADAKGATSSARP